MSRIGFAALAALMVSACPVSVTKASGAATAPTLFIDVKGDRIAYRTVGKGKPMVLITRMRGTLDTWDPVFLDELAKHNRIITVDYPGVGHSGGKLPASIGQTADFVL